MFLSSLFPPPPHPRRYYRDPPDTHTVVNNRTYVPAQQPGAADSGSDTGPTLYSGLWSNMYSAALQGNKSDTVIWVAGRVVGGEKCEAAYPSDPATCVPAVWYAQVRRANARCAAPRGGGRRRGRGGRPSALPEGPPSRFDL
jgi:hypothetical protein